MSVDFDLEIDRKNTAAEKWVGRKTIFGTEDVIPLWVADMDFPVPEGVTRALVKRAEHPLYGYTLATEGAFTALTGWLEKRHGWKVPHEQIMLAPGVVPSIYTAIHAFTKPGDGIIVQTPVYPPVFTLVTDLERRLILNPLRSENGRHVIDFNHFEKCAADGARMFIFCSPHNPVGRVWNVDELHKLLAICRKHKIVILSDEIHSDLIYPGHKHTPLMTLASKDDAIITAISPSKTFSISGMGLSALVAPDPQHRAAIKRAFGLLHFGDMSCVNPFSITAFEAAYREGAAWLDALMAYLSETQEHVISYLAEHAPAIIVKPSEGTDLLWLDCRKMGLSDEALKTFFVEKAKVGLSVGTHFGAEGSGFMRMNIAAPRAIIDRALKQIGAAFKETWL